MLLTPIALMHTPHLDSHKHPRPDGGVHATIHVDLVGVLKNQLQYRYQDVQEVQF